MCVLKVKVISLSYIFQVLYALCFTRPRYQVSVYRTIGPLVSSYEPKAHQVSLKYSLDPSSSTISSILANQSQNLCGATMGMGNESLFVISG